MAGPEPVAYRCHSIVICGWRRPATAHVTRSKPISHHEAKPMFMLGTILLIILIIVLIGAIPAGRYNSRAGWGMGGLGGLLLVIIVLLLLFGAF